MGRNPSKSGVTVETIAQEAGVSNATVSRVFNRKGVVREELVQKILKIAEKRGFSPRQATRRDTLVLVVEDTQQQTLTSYGAAVFRELIHACSQEFYRLDIVTAGEANLVRGRFILGAIGLLWKEPSLRAFEKIVGAPLCAINSATTAPTVCSNEKQGIGLALDYLRDKGHRHIGLITRGFESYGDAERRVAFRELMSNRATEGLVRSEIVFDGSANDLTMGLAKHFRTKIGRSNGRSAAVSPTALLAMSEDTGILLMHCLDLLGIRVPKDVSVISQEAPAQSAYLIPPNTTIGQDFKGLVDRAIARVTEDQADAPLAELVPYKLIERESVADLREPVAPGGLWVG